MGNSGTQTAAIARIAAAALCASAAILVLLIVSGSSWHGLDGKVFAAVILFAIFSLCSLAGFLLIKRQPHLASLGLATIVLSAAAYFVVLDAFWSNNLSGRHVSVEILVVLTLAVAQASMLLSFRRDEDGPTVDAVLFCSLGVLTLLTALVIGEISSPGPDISRKVLASLSVIYLLCALLPPLLRRTES